MISISNLTFRYSGRLPEVLKGADLRLEKGEIGVIMGRNGAGKTTLFRNVLGIEKPAGGQITFDGRDLLKISARERARLIAYVPQHIHFGEMSVFDSVLMGRISYFGFRAGAEDREAVRRILREMDLEVYADRNAEQLSGGEKQKVAIARALAQEPQMLIFDEPTGNLDLANEELLIEEAVRLSEERGITILSSMHDLNRAASFADRLFFMKDGRIRYDVGPDEVNEEMIEEIFGIKAEIAEVGGRKIILTGRSLQQDMSASREMTASE